MLQPRSGTQNASANLVPLGVKGSWEEGLLGARASRQRSPSLAQPRPSPPTWINRQRRHELSFGLADAVPAHTVAACSIALKLSGGQRDSMRAGCSALPGVSISAVRPGECLAGSLHKKHKSAPLGKLPNLPANRASRHAVPAHARRYGRWSGRRPNCTNGSRINTNSPHDRGSFLQPQAARKCFCVFVPWVWPCPGMKASWERGRPARTKPCKRLGHLPHMDQPGSMHYGLARWGSRRQDARCLQHRTKARRRPKGQHRVADLPAMLRRCRTSGSGADHS